MYSLAQCVRRGSGACGVRAGGAAGCGRMSGASRDAPLGVRALQRLAAAACPRWRIDRLRWYQGSVLALTYLTYMTYHLTRKPISVVKSVLHQNCSALPPPPGLDPGDDQWCNWPPFNTRDANTLLGALDSAFLFSYAAAMFVSGMVAERVDLRYFLSLGMLFSAVFCYLFGLARTYSVHGIWYYLLVQAGAGIAQTSGWPGTVAIVGKWFGDAKKGLIFGIWNSHTSLGNILGTLMAAAFVDGDWSLSFIYPALVMGSMGGVVWLFLVPEPAAVGLAAPSAAGPPPSVCRQAQSDDDAEDAERGAGGEPAAPAHVILGDQAASLRPHRHSANTAERDTEATEATSLLGRRAGAGAGAGGGGGGAVSLARALAIPGVVQFSLSLFFAKLVSYTFLYWLPLYINTSTHLSARASGELSTVFDAGGAAGAILAGLVADRTGAPALVCVVFYALCAPALLAYQAWGAGSYAVNCCLLAVTGALVNGPYALITTAVSADLGTHSSLAGNAHALATVTAIIDGTGSVGAALGPALAGVVSATSWSRVFLMLIACDALALLLLLRIAATELSKLRQERRLSSPARVRIE